MADPTIQTFCCHHHNGSDFAFKLMHEFNRERYLIISLISSTIGIFGSLYQIFVRKEESDGSPRRFMGRRIIVCLAYSDLMASFGIFIRSALWSILKEIVPFDDDSVSVIFCAVSSAWIQMFYTATWLWTFLYAFNMQKALLNQIPSEKSYHIFVWSISILLTSIGTSSLYYPDADCHDIHDIWTALLRVMPNYIMNYGPIAFVMFANPIIYVMCSREVDHQLVERYGQYTNNERQIKDIFRIKFLLINLIFYLCWLPNIISAIVIWTMWDHLPVSFVIISWHVIAILNPLQAFFNAFVYRKWSNKINCCFALKQYFVRNFQGNVNSQVAPTEYSPLLHSDHTTQSFILTRNIQGEPSSLHRYSIQCSPE